MFATDRDLLALEPNLFRDVGWTGQQLVKGIGSISGTTLTLASEDVNFEGAGVEAGHVVQVDGVAYEVLARTGATTVTISRLRDDPGGPAITPSPVTTKTVIVSTFRPQLAIVHRLILRMLGIEPDMPEPGQPTEASITNAAALRHLECLGALSGIYFASAPPDATWSDHQFNRVQVYRERYAAERQRAVARIDLDGDGLPDATRRLNTIQFIRA
jgi:hypothetical protein